MTREYNKARYEMVIDKVDPEVSYDLATMVREDIFWWVKDIRSYRAIVEADQLTQKILVVRKTGEGLGTRYQIEGRSIIKFLEVYGPGIQLTQQTWQKKKKK